MVKLKKQDSIKEAEVEIERIDVDSTYVKVSSWIEQYGSILPYVGISFIVLLVVLYRFLAVGENEALADYQRADFTYQQLIAEPGDATNLERLNLLKETHPELNSKYDAFLAELYFAHNKNDKGIALSEKILKRTSDFTDKPQKSFTATTLLIAKGENDKALIQAEELEKALAENPDLEVLRAFNLLRISALYHHAGQQQKAGEAWKSYNQKISDATRRKIDAHFQMGSASLESLLSSK